jgi:DNA-binding response OmpR family regulator
MKVLLVEDDVDLGMVLSQFLRLHEFDVVLAPDGETGWEEYLVNKPDICVLDVMLPGMDGFSLAKKIKTDKADMPLIFLTAKNMKEDRLVGLSLGADDYICKPFEADELVLRIKNILRRTRLPEDELIQIGSFRFSYSELMLLSEKGNIQLTLREAELLKYLFQHRNTLVERDQVLKELWGEADYFLGRSLDVFISRLRKFFENDPAIQIRTIRGKGFMMKVK